MLETHEIVVALKELLPEAVVVGGSFRHVLPSAASLARSDRRRVFLDARRAATRRCIAEALREAGAVAVDVPNNPGGDRAWPHGLLGSVSHKASVVAAAVAHASGVRSLGIDLEKVDQSLVPIQRLVAADGLPSDTDIESALTIVFCAKESVFKALYPQTHKSIAFGDVHLAWTFVDDMEWRAVTEVCGSELAIRCRQVGRWIVSIAISHSYSAT